MPSTDAPTTRMCRIHWALRPNWTGSRSDHVVTAVADTRDADALAVVVAGAEARWGGLDAAVAAAAVIAGGVPAWEVPAGQERAVLDIDLGGVLTLARVAVPAMLRRPQPRRGRFLAVASAAATRGLPMLAAYCAAKAGVAGFVRALAVELRGTGVTANAVSPGSTDTAMLAESARLYGLPGAECVRRAATGRTPAASGRDRRGGRIPRERCRRRHDGRGRPRRRGPFGMTPGLPIGTRIDLDPSMKQIAADTVFGGSPARVLRLRPDGVAALAELRGGRVETPASSALARLLTDAGFAHPRVARRDLDATVVIPVRDRAPDLDRCLGAVGRDHPVVVVDDGSTDASAIATVCAEHGAKLVRRAVSGGPGPARNAALRLVGTEFVAFLDSDCVPPPGWIAALGGHFADPLVAAVAPRIVEQDRSAPSPLDLGPGPARVAPLTRVAYVPTAALVVRRATLGDGFDETMRYGEDVDLVWRLVEAGHRVRYEPAVQVMHTAPRSLPALLRRRFHYGTSAAPLTRRHPGAVAPLVLHPWPALTTGALLARRPAVAGAAFAASTLLLARRLRDRGVPADGMTRAMAGGVVQTWLGTGPMVRPVRRPGRGRCGRPSGRSHHTHTYGAAGRGGLIVARTAADRLAAATPGDPAAALPGHGPCRPGGVRRGCVDRMRARAQFRGGAAFGDLAAGRPAAGVPRRAPTLTRAFERRHMIDRAF